MPSIMRQVKNSHVKEIGYDADTKTLIITFSSGTYTYDDVPAEIDAELRAVEAAGHSVGKYFHANIRTRFTATRLPEPIGQTAA